jgi:uncharacterized membrane protein YgcG
VAGKRILLRHRDRRSIDAAVAGAEARTGLQFCVYLGPASADTRSHAEGLFVDAGLHEQPAVLIHVAPDHRRVEIVTAPAVRERIPDEACSRAITEMTQHFANGRFVDGLLAGIASLAHTAGPGAPDGSPDLPNVVE